MVKDKDSGKKIRPSQNTFDIKVLETKSNTELLQAIDEMLARPVEEVDGNFVDACLDILQDRVPVAENYDPQVTMDRLHEKHPELFEIENELPANVVSMKRRRHVPLIHYAGTFVAVMLCLVVTANAFGYNPIQAFLKWVNDTIQIYSNPSGQMELPPDDPNEYHSLEEALKACGASSADRITWIPKDYSILNVRVASVGNITKVTAIYEAERGELAIRILSVTDAEWAGIVESDFDGVEYDHGGVTFYITSNYEIMKAGWMDNQYSYVISGHVSKEEIIKMINSIT